MLLLTKTILSIMLGFLLATSLGLVLIPILKKLNIRQSLSIYMEDAHRKKTGTPTMGGLIFLIPTIATVFLLHIMGKLEITTNLLIVMFVLIGYAAIGFIDDYLIIRKHNNKGLTEVQKLFAQAVIAIIFFFLFLKTGGETNLVISTLGINIPMGWLYGVFIMFLLVGGSNAVNITDGLDGLAGGLSAIAFIAFGLISLNCGYEDIGIFCFILCGSLVGFLVFNIHPARIFMGDTGSLALGATLAAIAILVRREVTLVIVAGVFIIETLTVILQIFWVKVFHKKLFLMSPLHHHFEKLGWSEVDIVKLFWVFGLILSMAGIFFGVWL